MTCHDVSWQNVFWPNFFDQILLFDQNNFLTKFFWQCFLTNLFDKIIFWRNDQKLLSKQIVKKICQEKFLVKERGERRERRKRRKDCLEDSERKRWPSIYSLFRFPRFSSISLVKGGGGGALHCALTTSNCPDLVSWIKKSHFFIESYQIYVGDSIFHTESKSCHFVQILAVELFQFTFKVLKFQLCQNSLKIIWEVALDLVNKKILFLSKSTSTIIFKYCLKLHLKCQNFNSVQISWNSHRPGESENIIIEI